jgi:hypothetical protein
MQDQLIALRTMTVVFVTGMFIFGIATVLIVPTSAPPMDRSLAFAVVCGMGGVSLAGTEAVGRRRLDCSSGSALLASYRYRFFVRAAFAEAAAIGGLVMTNLSSYQSCYFLGAGFAIVGFTRLAPSARNIHEDQNSLLSTGCPLSLLAVLRGTHER